MRNYMLLFAFVSSLVLWQGCSPKSDESAADAEELKATLVKNQEMKDRTIMHAEQIKAKEAQRRLMIAETARLTPTYKDSEGNVIYYKAETEPSYTGGLDELSSYLKENLKYPADARTKGYEGTVFVDFVVTASGKVREVIATDVVGENVDISFKEESVRVVSAMPGWKAGRQNGKAVDASFSIPITFQLND
jgi:periplasmic protein TonB